MGIIEVERHRRANPPVPEWLSGAYHQAWQELLPLALIQLSESTDPLMIRSALSVVALARGQVKAGALILLFDDPELKELVEEGLAWSQLYDDARPKLGRS